MVPDIGLANWFAQRARRTPERRALSFEGQSWTYGQLLEEVDDCAAWLKERGVERSTRVAFLGLNQPMFLIIMFAAAKLGAIYVPLNFRLSAAETAFVVNDAAVHTLISDEKHRPLIESIRDELTTVSNFVSLEPATDWTTYGKPTSGQVESVAVDPSDPVIIMYTSGTTGRAKGAILTHGNLWWNNVNAINNFDVYQNDVTLAGAPLFHIGGLNVITLVTLQKGGEVVLMRSFDPTLALKLIADHKVTTMFGVPAMFQFMAQIPDFERTDISSMRMLICGGAPCPLSLLEIYERRGVAVQQGYGMTETAPMITFLAPEYASSKIGSSGRTPIFTEIRIVAGDGSIIDEPEARGEVQVRGPNVTPGYWNLPETTREAFTKDGWFKTGDVAYVDSEQFIYICDRIKDMIISGGENIYPAEVESVLFKHPSIADVAVIGLPDEKWGETVTAVVKLKAGESLDLDGLRDFCDHSLARYKLPRRLEFLEELPRNATGKLLKVALRKQFADLS